MRYTVSLGAKPHERLIIRDNGRRNVLAAIVRPTEGRPTFDFILPGPTLVSGFTTEFRAIRAAIHNDRTSFN